MGTCFLAKTLLPKDPLLAVAILRVHSGSFGNGHDLVMPRLVRSRCGVGCREEAVNPPVSRLEKHQRSQQGRGESLLVRVGIVLWSLVW